MSLAQVYLSGEVRRWHTNPTLAGQGQTLADHHGRAAQLLLVLHPGPGLALVRAVLFHDVGELHAGDLSQPFKQRAPDLARAHAAIEGEMRDAIVGLSFPDLTALEVEWLHLVDRLEALLFVMVRAPAEAGRLQSGWGLARQDILGRARVLGCHEAVVTVLRDIEGGEW